VQPHWFYRRVGHKTVEFEIHSRSALGNEFVSFAHFKRGYLISAISRKVWFDGFVDDDSNIL
jgi:hypothetical protein